MILFVDIEGVLVQNCFRKENYSHLRHIILNEKNFNWIKNQNFKKIFIVTNQKGISEGWLNEQLFDLELEYIRKSLEVFSNVQVDCRYYPYQKENGYLIQDILKEFEINKDNAIILGSRKAHKKDAALSGLRYIDLKEL